MHFWKSKDLEDYDSDDLVPNEAWKLENWIFTEAKAFEEQNLQEYEKKIQYTEGNLHFYTQNSIFFINEEEYPYDTHLEFIHNHQVAVAPISTLSSILLFSQYTDKNYNQNHIDLLKLIQENCPCKEDISSCSLMCSSFLKKSLIHIKRLQSLSCSQKQFEYISCSYPLIQEQFKWIFRNLKFKAEYCSLWERIFQEISHVQFDLKKMEDFWKETQEFLKDSLEIIEKIYEKINQLSIFYIYSLNEDLFDLIYGGFEQLNISKIQDLAWQIAISALRIVDHYQELLVKRKFQNEEILGIKELKQVIEGKDQIKIWKKTQSVILRARYQLESCFEIVLEPWYRNPSFIKDLIGFETSFSYKRSIGKINWKLIKILLKFYEDRLHKSSSDSPYRPLTILQIQTQVGEEQPIYIASKIFIDKNDIIPKIPIHFLELIQEIEKKDIQSQFQLSPGTDIILTVGTFGTDASFRFEDIWTKFNLEPCKDAMKKIFPKFSNIRLFPGNCSNLFDYKILFSILRPNLELDISKLPILSDKDELCLGRELAQSRIDETLNTLSLSIL